MLLLPLTICLLFAQGDDVHQRILHVLGPEVDQRAELLLKEKQYQKVEEMLSDAHGNDGEISALRGVLEFMSGSMEASIKSFSAAAASGTLREQDRFTLAMAWIQTGRNEEARSEISKLARAKPDSALYAYWLGRVDYDDRRYTEAVEHLKHAIELDAKSARAWDSLGLAYDMQGRSEDALKALQQSAALNRSQAHQSPWPPHDLGSVLLRTGETKQAEAAFREALQDDPEMPQAHYNLGRALEKQGADMEALAEYIKATELDTKSTEACYSLAILYRKMHKDKESEAMFAEWRRRRNLQP